MAFTQTAQRISVSTPLGADKLLLRRFNGQEAISELFDFRLEMQSEDNALTFASIVGKSATVSVVLADGTKRYINGIVSRFVQAGSDARFTTYYAELRPWFWLMTMSADCRIWQNKSVIDIVTGLFSELGFTDFKNSTTGTYTALEYCVQYNETAFAFVSRMLERFGIFYFFTHEDGKHTLVLADDPSAFADCAGAATVDYGVVGGEWQQENVVVDVSIEEAVIAGKFAVDDFSFETPSTDLMGTTVSSLATNGSTRRIFEYPGKYTKKDESDAISKLRMEERETPQKALRGTSFTPAFTAGGKTTLAKHYRTDANQAYALLRVTHSADRDRYTNSFEAFPATVTYRPPRVTPRPFIRGTQTAIVVGKSGEEIWTDQYGRIKVQFHWDQLGTNDENSSCWIRVAHGWAGKTWGQMFLPRIGQEVVVSFLEGDPDRPLITGSVYNAEQTVPYTLPDMQTKSTIKSNTSKGGGGYNEFRFEDLKDSEEIYLQAQRDMNTVIKNNETHKVGFETKSDGNQTIDVYKNRTVTLDQGDDLLEVKTGNLTTKVNTGNETRNVKGTRTTTVEGDETQNSKANFTHNVTSKYVLKVDGDLEITVGGKVTFKSTGDMTLQTSGNLVEKATSDVTVQGMNVTAKATTDATVQGTNVNNKASANLNQEGAMIATKASGMHNVEASGILTLKGSLTKIN